MIVDSDEDDFRDDGAISSNDGNGDVDYFLWYLLSLISYHF